MNKKDLTKQFKKEFSTCDRIYPVTFNSIYNRIAIDSKHFPNPITKELQSLILVGFLDDQGIFVACKIYPEETRASTSIGVDARRIIFKLHQNDPVYGDEAIFLTTKSPSKNRKREEHILVFRQEYLPEFIRDPDRFFSDLPNENIKSMDINVERGRSMISKYNRNYKFRIQVLGNYGFACAVCRNDHQPVLEAAHIIPVSDSGSDSVVNGICLCRNHHKLFDEGLLQINWNNNTFRFQNLTGEAERLESAIIFRYHGKLLLPKISLCA